MTAQHPLYQDVKGRWHYPKGVGRMRLRGSDGRFLSAAEVKIRLDRAAGRMAAQAESAPRAARHEVGAIVRPPASHRNAVPNWQSRQTERDHNNRKRWTRQRATKNAKHKARAALLFGQETNHEHPIVHHCAEI